MFDNNLEVIDVLDTVERNDGTFFEIQLMSDGSIRTAAVLSSDWDVPF